MCAWGDGTIVFVATGFAGRVRVFDSSISPAFVSWSWINERRSWLILKAIRRWKTSTLSDSRFTVSNGSCWCRQHTECTDTVGDFDHRVRNHVRCCWSTSSRFRCDDRWESFGWEPWRVRRRQKSTNSQVRWSQVSKIYENIDQRCSFNEGFTHLIVKTLKTTRRTTPIRIRGWRAGEGLYSFSSLFWKQARENDLRFFFFFLEFTSNCKVWTWLINRELSLFNCSFSSARTFTRTSRVSINCEKERSPSNGEQRSLSSYLFATFPREWCRFSVLDHSKMFLQRLFLKVKPLSGWHLAKQPIDLTLTLPYCAFNWSRVIVVVELWPDVGLSDRRRLPEMGLGCAVSSGFANDIWIIGTLVKVIGWDVLISLMLLVNGSILIHFGPVAAPWLATEEILIQLVMAGMRGEVWRRSSKILSLDKRMNSPVVQTILEQSVRENRNQRRDYRRYKPRRVMETGSSKTKKKKRRDEIKLWISVFTFPVRNSEKLFRSSSFVPDWLPLNGQMSSEERMIVFESTSVVFLSLPSWSRSMTVSSNVLPIGGVWPRAHSKPSSVLGDVFKAYRWLFRRTEDKRLTVCVDCVSGFSKSAKNVS